ncbi:Receptor kinase [Rhynchospora pubera]|uniref:Receptor kinase n=1 Tax=Rhynchospora pubera TaxID=906938 RepID=A0AAV8F8L4_9POAL|nr:Receptor kinase [Rhynchospora pubera]
MKMSLPYFFFLCLFLLSFSDQALAVVCASTCGQVQEIRYPFRLQSDPPECGSPNYELICKNNRTLIQVGSAEGHYYLIRGISYENRTIEVVDPALIHGNCTLPSIPRSFKDFYSSPVYLDRLSFASFMNCTMPIQQKNYWHVPCLSHNGTFVYIYYGDPGYFGSVPYLKPSCGFLAITPFNTDTFINSSADIFRHLQEGFLLYWDDGKWSNLAFLHYCFKESIRQFLNETRSNKDVASMVYLLLKNEKHFVSCVYIRCTQLKYFYFALALLVIVWLLQLILAFFISGRLIFTPLSILFFIAQKFWSERISIDSIEKFLQNQGKTISPKRYAYTDIIALTGHFRKKLGQGGFGSVFKGKSISGQEVAIKMLGSSKFNGEEFINEVSTLGRIYHINVVQLLGYCSEGSKRALVYEYMPNGSLDRYIFSENGSPCQVFSWEKLTEIALGVARGIDYLHRGCDMQILHFDIKPHNILLDKSFIPKISDFGLAKLYPRDRSLVSVSAARGTIGYIAPELVSRSFGVISYKSDVYSFGMLLLEMAGGRRNAEPRVENASRVYYPSWIYEKLKEYKGVELSNTYKINVVERKLCIVGLWCIQMKSSDRPPMSRVVEMLEGDVDCLPFPPPPFFSTSENNWASEPLRVTTLTSLGMSEISEEADYPLLSE